MTRILICKDCEAFDAKCECGERTLSLCSKDSTGQDLMMDKKGWVYVMDSTVFIPRIVNKGFIARSRCMECGRVNRYWFQFESGILKSWRQR